MGARHAYFNVNNFTAQNLEYVGDDVKHGRYITSPPKEIKMKAKFSVCAHDGSMIGPEGNCTYQAKDKSFKVTFYWHHPYGHGTSNYSAVGDPSEAVNAAADPPEETGHTQYIAYDVMRVE